MNPPGLLLACLLLGLAPAGAESFQSWAARGVREEREKDPQAAFSSYSNALSLWDASDGQAGKAKVLCARAGLREQDGDDEGAIKDLSDCLALDKKNGLAFHHRGLLYLKAGKLSPAISDFYKASALKPGFGPNYAARGRAYALQGETRFAWEDHKRACELGVKESCARQKELTPGKAKPATPAPKPPADEVPTAPAAPAPEPPAPAPTPESPPPPEPAPPQPEPTPAPPKPAAMPEPAQTAPSAPSPQPAPPAPKPEPAPPSYQPRFRDCRRALDGCLQKGDSFGGCVAAAASCELKPAKGCCPAACLKAFQRAVDDESASEAQAFREYFSPQSACAKPKTDDN